MHPTYLPDNTEHPRVTQMRNILADAETRVARQQRLIQWQKRRGQSTEAAEKLLQTFNKTLLQLRNHFEIRASLEFAPKGKVAGVRGELTGTFNDRTARIFLAHDVKRDCYEGEGRSAN